jgi:hypothetical protein
VIGGKKNNDCSQQSYLDGFLEELRDDLDIGGKSDIFDLKNIEWRL